MQQPPLNYEYKPCPQCGAADATAAENICKATQGMDGDYHCAADGGKEDAEGRFMFPTRASLHELDNWYEAYADGQPSA